MKKYNYLLLILTLSTFGLDAQQKDWTLQECIRYALDNNIQIKQQGIQTRYQKNALDLAKFRLLPTINGSASHNYSFGRALDQTTYQYTEAVISDNLYFSSNLTLFNGLQNQNAIKKANTTCLQVKRISGT
jgi:outer membrane protein